jgi:methyl-accepting chemotaxis protein
LRLNVQGKLYALAGLLLFFLAAVGALAISNLGAVHTLGETMYDEQVVPLVQIGSARAHVAEIDSEVLLAATNPARRADAVAAVERSAAAVEKELEHELSGDLRTHWEAYQAAYGAVLKAGDPAAAQRAYAVADQAETVVEADLEKLAGTEQAASRALDEEITKDFHTAREETLIALALALLAGIAIATFIARGIKRGVDQLVTRFHSLDEHDLTALSNGLGAVAEGDLTVPVARTTGPIEKYGTDEIGVLSETFNAMLAKIHGGLDSYNEMRAQLNQVMADISRGAGTVSAASEEMAAVSEESGRAVGEIAAAVGDVAQGAERQVRMVESTREIFQEAARAAGASAGTARETAAAALEASGVAQQGVAAAVDATEAIRQVAESSARVDTAIRALHERSDQIGGIVTTIAALAEQTNLLALNAAIEAARAGEQGKGFAVVAEEVRKLAEESSTATREISRLVAEIQHETGEVVGVVAEGARRTQDGVATVQQTRAAFEQIGAVVEQMSDRVGAIVDEVGRIAAESGRAEQDITEVALVAEQSSASVEQVSASSEETSASAEEIAASAQSLSSTAQELHALVSRFKVAA